MRLRFRSRVGETGSWARGALLALLLSLSACGLGSSPRSLILSDVPGGDAELGRTAIGVYGCGSCHTIPGVPGADALVGPPLTLFAYRKYIAGMLPNTPDNLVTWIRTPQAVVPGNAMPNMGVSERDARNIAAYLSTLK
jgi:cytochrome c